MKTFIKTYTSADQIQNDLKEINSSDMKIVILKNGTSDNKDVLFYGRDNNSNMFMNGSTFIEGKSIPVGIQGDKSFAVYYGENNPGFQSPGEYVNGYVGIPGETVKSHFDANLRALLGL